MATLEITNRSKNSLTVTNQNKDLTIAWNEATFTWDNSTPLTWNTQGLHLTRPSKNSLTITNRSKS